MRSIVAWMTLALILVSAALAVSQKEMTDMYTARLTNDLALTDRQVADARPLIDSAIIGLNRAATADPEERREAMRRARNLSKETSERIREILDDTQQAKFDSLSHPVLPSLQLIRLNNGLRLTSEQVGQIEEIIHLYLPYSPRQPHAEQNREQSDNNEFRQNMDQMNKAIEQVLTDNQKKLFAEMQKEREEHRPRDGRPERRPRQF